MTRRKRLGDLGERWTCGLLEEAGFDAVRALNSVRHNHPGGDFLAQRHGEKYFITVKTRNKYVQGSRRLNGGYNIFPEKVRKAAKEYDAIPAWTTIQVDTDDSCYSAYYGTIDSLPNPLAVSVPMSSIAVSRYECLAKDKFDAAITSALSNQPIETIAERAGPRARRLIPSGQPNGSGTRSPRTIPLDPRSAVKFEDYVAYTDPAIQPILQELQKRIRSLRPPDNVRIKEKPTKHQRIAYSVSRIFAEVKVQKKRILIRFFGSSLPDPRNLITVIPATHKWQHEKEMAVTDRASLDYVMPHIEASYRSHLTTLPVR